MSAERGVSSLPREAFYTGPCVYTGPVREDGKGTPSQALTSPVLPLKRPTVGPQSKTADAETQSHPLECCVDQGPSSQGVHSVHRPELRRRSAARLEAGKSKLSPANHRAEHMHVEDGTVVCSFLSKLNILHVPL